MNPLAADKRFFNALIAGDVQALNRILADDFILIDVMSGSEITKAAFLAATGSGQVKFKAIEPADNRVRLYQTTAIITGRTQMNGRLGDALYLQQPLHSRFRLAAKRMAVGHGARHSNRGDNGIVRLNAKTSDASNSAVCQQM